MGFIYLIENIQNGKKYVGLTTRTTEVRWKEHLRHNRDVIDIAIQKHGAENFNCIVLEECADEELDNREQFWISYYNTYNDGYNCTEGGRRAGMNIEVDSKYKIIKQLWDKGLLQKEIQKETGYNIATVHNYLLKYGVTEEEIRKRANNAIGKNKSKAVLQYDKNGSFIKEWSSITEAANALNINRKNISNVCVGKRKTCGGYIWRHKE